MTLYERYTCLKPKKEQIEQAVNILIASYKNGGMLLLCGNGGSAADCSHITGELMKGFLLKRPLEVWEKRRTFFLLSVHPEMQLMCVKR